MTDREEKIVTKLDRELLENGLIAHLQGIDSENLVRLFYSEYDAIVDFARLCAGGRAGAAYRLRRFGR